MGHTLNSQGSGFYFYIFVLKALCIIGCQQYQEEANQACCFTLKSAVMPDGYIGFLLTLPNCKITAYTSVIYLVGCNVMYGGKKKEDVYR